MQAERHEKSLERMRVIADQCPLPVNRNFYLFGLDTTTQSRPFANTLEDRGFQHSPNPAPGNRPITVGHAYSVLAALPEKQGAMPPPWIIPLLVQRVPSDQKSTDIGADQVMDILTDDKLNFGSHLCVLTGDSTYSSRSFLGQTGSHENLVAVVRVRGNRVFYDQHQPTQEPAGKGHPVWFGNPFDLKNPSAQREPDLNEVLNITLGNGRECCVSINGWENMLMRGTRYIPMHKYPFTLIRIMVKDMDGKDVFKKPLWLIIIGRCRNEISISDAYHAYRQRYDMEHFFRFGKTKLLMASYQTPIVEHEENWWEIVAIAYVNLYTAVPIAKDLPYPWERWHPKYKEADDQRLPSPSAVQRDMPRIINAFGTPAKSPKPRGKSPGRQKGQFQVRRMSLPVVKKGKNEPEIHAQAA